jgi:ribosomal-protein-alanine N-acetyltransferase
MRIVTLDQQVSAAWIDQAASLSCLLNEPQWNQAQLVAACHGGDLVLAAVEHEQVVGYLIVATVLDEAEIHTILVDQKQRGKGIAKQLLAEAINVLRQQGIQQVFLEVRASNNAAKGLYTGFGFQSIGERKNYYKNADGSRESAILMQLNMQ